MLVCVDDGEFAMNRLTSRLAGAALAASCTLAFSDGASGAVRAFSSKGAAQFVSPTDFVGVGNATHLGLYREAGSVAFSPTGNPAVLHVAGAITYTAADGSELRALVAGELNGVTGVVGATITYVGGTGRLLHAIGSASLAGQVLPDGSMTVAVNGTIDY